MFLMGRKQLADYCMSSYVVILFLLCYIVSPYTGVMYKLMCVCYVFVTQVSLS